MTTSTHRCIQLHVTDKAGVSTEIEIKPGTYLIGRSDRCQIRFPDVTVSRQHARLAIGARGVRIDDLESNTGTRVNGRAVRTALLRDQDVVEIAHYTLQLSMPVGGQLAATSPEETPALTERSRAGGVGDGTSAARRANDPNDPDTLEASGVPSDRELDLLVSDLETVRMATTQLLDVMATRIVGQKNVLRSIWAAILARGHCLLVGVPGLAKTLMVSTFSEALGLSSKRVQFTPDLLPTDILGSNVIHEGDDGKRYFEFVKGPIFTQFLLADEINRTPPKTQAALLEAMQEYQVTVANQSFPLPQPFFVIATQNPIEQEGTYPLPEAQQDRFMLSLHLDYPSREDEIDILIETCRAKDAGVTEVISASDITNYQAICDRVAVSRELASFCADLVRATRPTDPRSPPWLRDVVDWGAGPRAGQALIRTSKALAAMDGRPAISRDDVLASLRPVLRHRIACNFRARTEGLNEPDIIQRLAEEVPAP